MSIFLSFALFIIGVLLIVRATENLVEGILGSAILIGVSTFILGVILGGFDPENLAAGIAGALKGLSGVALGTIIGSTIFLIGIALGVAAILVPLEKVEINPRLILLTLLSPLPLLAAIVDEKITRAEGLVMLVFFAPIIYSVFQLSQNGEKSYLKTEEIEKVEKEKNTKGKVYFLGVTVLSIIIIVIGAEMLAFGAKGIVNGLGISQTFFGMIFVAAAVSFEEIVREIIPAYKGHPEISIGNILGTILFFVLFNVGIIALIHPLSVNKSIIYFHYPFMMGILAIACLFIYRKRVGRLEGSILIACYLVYLLGSIYFR